MELPTRHNDCIWCSRPFNIQGFQPRPNLVERSREHVFPGHLGGTVISWDICSGCNNGFGATTDHALLQDETLFKAIQRLNLNTMLPDMRVSLGEAWQCSEYLFKKGRFKLIPRFSGEQFGIGLVEGRLDSNDLRNAKNFWVKRLLARNPLRLTQSEIEARVDALFRKAMSVSPPGEVMDEKLGHGLKISPIPSAGTVTRKCDGWKVQWAVGKIAYEIGMVAPSQIQGLLPLLAHIKSFVEARQISKGLFQEVSTNEAKPTHMAEVLVTKRKARISVTMFGAKTWTVMCPVQAGKDFNGFRVKVVNELNGKGLLQMDAENGSE